MPASTHNSPIKTEFDELITLAAEITANATKLHDYISSNNLPYPSFDKDGPASFPIPESESKLQLARFDLLEATAKMRDLVLGPNDLLNSIAVNAKYEAAVLRTINNHSIASAVPLGGEASFADIAEKTNLNEEFISRIIRFAATSHIFMEKHPGFVSHTAASASLAKDQVLQSAIHHNLDDTFPATAKIDEAVERYGACSGEPSETAFAVAFGVEGGFWEFMKTHEERLGHFHKYMSTVSKGQGYDSRYILDGSGLGWDKLEDAVVCDVGGSTGHVSAMLAREYPNIKKFVIQDLPEVVSSANIPEDLEDRIEFMPHSFLDPQPIVADVYILRFVLHDWSDKYAVKILKNLMPALKQRPDVRIVLMETLLPAPGKDGLFKEKLQRSFDLQMMTLVNARERTLKDWQNLVHLTGLRILKVNSPKGSALSMIEVGL